MIGDLRNNNNVFFRDLTICVLDKWEGSLKWTNRFSSGDVQVNVPFYYSLTGDERFLLDSFVDDVVSDNRATELNTDVIPRGSLTLTGMSVKSDEMTNPNIWLKMTTETSEDLYRYIARIRALPIVVNYDMTVIVNNELEAMRVVQQIQDNLFLYKSMYFEYSSLRIDAVMLMPDNNSIEIPREANLSSDTLKKVTASFEVHTYYPAFDTDEAIILSPNGTRWYNNLIQARSTNK